MWAVQEEQIPVAKMLLEHGADLFARDKKGRSALTLAADRRNIAALNMLIDARNRLQPQKNVHGMQYLVCAASDGKIVEVKRVLGEAFAPGPEKQAHMDSSLLLAATNGHAEVVKILLKKGSDVNTTDALHRTPLMLAARDRSPRGRGHPAGKRSRC